MKSFLFLFWLLVGVTVILTFSIWWQIHPLTSCKCKGFMENNGFFLFQNQAHKELALKHLARLINSSEEDQNKKHKQTECVMGISQEVQNIQEITATLQIPWKINTSNVYQLRNDIAESVHTEMILTQNDVSPSEIISYVYQNKSVPLGKTFYNMLPKVSPILRNYKRCSIVGNGGILNGSKCGNEIDRADFVIRCNAPPITQFSEDVGVKSNITTVNPSIITLRFGGLLKRKQHSSFIKSIKQYKHYIWFPSLSSARSFSTCLKASDLLKKNRNNIKVLNGNPNHFREINRYWKNNYDISKTISSGFYITTSALLYCEEIHLYGFWPFYTDLHNRPVTYHYFEKDKLKIYGHAFGKEFKELLRLHSDGILQLHVDKCSI